MAENRTLVHVPPEQVWAVFADGQTYADWVVGAKEIRRVDEGWPSVGTSLHHSVGAGPANVKDATTAIEADAPKRLVLSAAFRPLGIAQITFVLKPTEGGTEVSMHEDIVDGFLARFYGRIMSGAVQARNVETLRRLKNLAEKSATSQE